MIVETTHKCPRCRHTFKSKTETRDVHDLVFVWSDTVMADARPILIAGMPDANTVMLGFPGQTGHTLLSIPLGRPVPHMDGKNHPFEILRIAPGVWILSMSIVVGQLHAHVTIVGCPAETAAEQVREEKA